MRQDEFERAHAGEWDAFEALLDGRGADTSLEFPVRYRAICRDLALATDRAFGASLVRRLNRLALRGHQRLYRARGRRVAVLSFFAAGFPSAVRRDARLILAACTAFFGVGLAVLMLGLHEADLIYYLMNADQVAKFEEMYNPDASHYGVPRDSVGDFGAFAFYTSNNIGVALRTFAWGIFGGIGSILLLLFNGTLFGSVAAHVTQLGFAVPFFSFVVGHGAFELPAIAIAGAAGMKLGWSLVSPGEHTRGQALRDAAATSIPLLYGTVAMLLVAAVIEAFWSSSRWIEPEVKFAVGGVLWLFVGAWLGFGGRARAH